MILLAAEKPVDAVINPINSLDKSTLLSSKAPETIRPAPRLSGGVMSGVPELGPEVNTLLLRAIRPASLAKVARTT